MKETCPNCLRVFSRKQNLKRHIEGYCPATDNSSYINKKTLLELIDGSITFILEFIIGKEKQIDELLQQNKKLKEEKKQLEKELQHFRNKYSTKTINNDHSLHTNNSKNDNSTNDNSNHDNDNSTHQDNSVNIGCSTNNITINLFGHENIDYLHIPDYLKNKFDIVQFVKDVHFHDQHPENHNVKIGEETGKIYQKLFLKGGKIKWQTYDKENTLSELIQNGETLLNSVDKDKLNYMEKQILDIVTDIVMRETYSNCLTEKLWQQLQEILKSKKFCPETNKK
jgi:hypothetical protein